MAAALQEEHRLLVLMAEDDAKEIARLKNELDCALGEKSRLQRRIDEQESLIRAQDRRVFEAEQAKFQAEVAAKTAARGAVDMREVEEERRLLAQQADADAMTIRGLQTSLHEALYERDRLARTVGDTNAERIELEAEVRLLQEHSSELRRSNESLAQQVAKLEEQVQRFEAEDYAQWFMRRSGRDLMQAQETLPREARRLDSAASPVGVASPVAAPSVDAFSKQRRQPHQATGHSPTSHHSYLVVRDALSGAIVPGADDDALDMSPTKYSDSDDSRPPTQESSAAHERLSSSAGATAAASSGVLSPARGAPFKTVRQARNGGGGSSAGIADSQPGGFTYTVNADPDLGHSRRPATSPLVIEAIYGEKGDATNRMYLVKYVNVEAEQWTNAVFVEAHCEALDEWKRSKARDRRGLV